MSEVDQRTEFLGELRRVLDARDAVGDEFFSWTGPMEDAQLAALTRWLRTLPSGIGESELVQRLQAWLGPYLSR